MHISMRVLAFGLAAALAVPAVPSAATAEPVMVFAASSLQTALDAVAAAWQREEGGTAVISYAGASALARQIEQTRGGDEDLPGQLDASFRASENRSEQGCQIQENPRLFVSSAQGPQKCKSLHQLLVSQIGFFSGQLNS